MEVSLSLAAVLQRPALERAIQEVFEGRALQVSRECVPGKSSLGVRPTRAEISALDMCFTVRKTHRPTLV